MQMAAPNHSALLELGCWSAGSPLRRCILISVLAGAYFGLIQGVDASSLGTGIFEGLLYGILFGGFVTWVTESRLKGTQPKDPDSRRKIFRCLFMGEDLADASLAPALMAYVNYLRSRQRKSNPGTTAVLMLAFTAGCLVYVGFLAHSHRWYAVGVWAFLALTIALSAGRMPQRLRRQEWNLNHAEEVARRALSA
jgi:hypothetical protein